LLRRENHRLAFVSKKLRDGDAERLTDRFYCGVCRRIVPFEQMGNGGLRQACLFCKLIFRPVLLVHQLLDPFPYIHKLSPSK
jgi:hypothetical protein